jgi:hypothetical protein
MPPARVSRDEIEPDRKDKHGDLQYEACHDEDY